MWKILLRVLLQNNNHCSEKHDWYISLQKIQARAMVPKQFLTAYSRMLHLEEKKNMWWSSDQHYKQTGGKTQTMYTRNWYGVKICEKLTHCAGAKDICGTMWLIFKSTHLVHPCTPHQVGTPLENSGTPSGVRYTRLTSTGVG